MKVILLSIRKNTDRKGGSNTAPTDNIVATYDVCVAFGETDVQFKTIIEMDGIIQITHQDENFSSSLASLGNGIRSRFFSNRAYPELFKLISGVHNGENLLLPMEIGDI